MADIEKRWMSKVAVGMRLKIPKDIVEIYRMKKGDVVEWICDEKGKIKIEVKEMVLKEKKAKVEKVKGEDVGGKAVVKADEEIGSL